MSEIKLIKDIIPDAVCLKKYLNKGFIIDDLVCISENDIGKHIKHDNFYKSNLHFLILLHEVIFHIHWYLLYF